MQRRYDCLGNDTPTTDPAELARQQMIDFDQSLDEQRRALAARLGVRVASAWEPVLLWAGVAAVAYWLLKE